MPLTLMTRSQLVEYLGIEDPTDDPDAITVRDVMETLGVSRSVASGILDKVVENGKLEKIVVFRLSNGRVCRMTGYRIRSQNKEEEGHGV